MAEPQDGRIARELMSEPHIEGRRLSVLRIYDLDAADVYHALAHYHDHPEEMRERREDRERALEEVRERIDRPPGVEPGSE